MCIDDNVLIMEPKFIGSVFLWDYFRFLCLFVVPSEYSFCDKTDYNPAYTQNKITALQIEAEDATQSYH